MTETTPQPEKAQETAPQQTETVQKKPEDPRVEAFRDKAEEQMKVAIQKREDMYKRADQMDQNAKQALRELIARQVNEVRDLYNRTIEQYKSELAAGKVDEAALLKSANEAATMDENIDSVI
jgi:hypothetical protein